MYFYLLRIMSDGEGVEREDRYHETYERSCILCGNQWSKWDECWTRCDGCACGLYVPSGDNFLYFQGTDYEGNYCNSCHEEKLNDIAEEKDALTRKEPEE